ncbi:MAG: DUF2147 domain-containing protein [Bacteroidota bacterium]
MKNQKINNKTLFLLVTILLSIHCLSAFTQGSRAIQGHWWNEERTSKIKIELQNGKYIGTIVYMTPETYVNGKPRHDENNPDPQLRDRAVEGLQIVQNLEYNPTSRQWINGSIYDPRSGNTYDCYAWIEGDVLKLKGYLGGFRWLGRESEWYRTTP